MTDLGKVSVRYLAAAVIVAYLSLWQFRVAGHLSATAFASFVLFVFLCLAYGRAFLSAIPGFEIQSSGVVSRFLCGFFAFNTLLFLLSLVSTLGMQGNLLILSLPAFILTVFGPKLKPNSDTTQQELPGLLCIILSGAGATLWCLDSQPMLLVQGPTAIYKTWQDTFIHVREISVFAQAHGIGSIQDIKLAGSAAPIYHFASYLSAAAVSALTGTSAIDTYSSFHLPVGIFLTGLAAFVLIASIWGGWPGLAAAVAVVLLPDAYQQGFANKYLSYNFLAQINLGLLYGIACASIAWMFILDGIRRAKAVPILVGHLFLAVCLLYKAHIFVANAFLIMIYPCLFFPGIRPRWRLIVGLAITALFVSVITFSQTIDRVPTLRLDGSGIGQYIVTLLKDFDAGMFKTFFTQVFKQGQHSKPVEGMYVAAMLLLSTFGLWILATPLLAVAAKRRTTGAVFFFPFLIIANYLFMTIGLALDTRGVGTPDELLNRPLVWAYFVVAAWTAGATYFLAAGNHPPQSKKAQAGVVSLLLVAFAGVFFLSSSLQTLPTRQGFGRYEEFNSVPLCLVKASEYIKQNSLLGDVIQDSENDPRFVVTALTERQLFAGKTTFGGEAKKHQERLNGLAQFLEMRDSKALLAYAAAHKISWYLLHPRAQVSWPETFLQKAVYTCEGFRVYRFPA